MVKKSRDAARMPAAELRASGQPGAARGAAQRLPVPPAAGALAALRQAARSLLADGTVDLFIGYGRSTSGDVVPRFIRRSEETDTLEWNESCTYNLARYLTDRALLSREQVRGGAGQFASGKPESGKPESGKPPARVAVMLKGCDLKAVKVLLSESQLRRERLYLVGLACGGVADAGGQLAAKCRICPPSIYNPEQGFCDRVIGDPLERAALEDSFEDVAGIESLSQAERRAFWDRTLARCLRCQACRNVCPLCYCSECVFDQHNPRWVSPAAGVAANRAFHLIRAYHLAGRCVDCGECERSCPVGIPLRSINRKLAHLVKESFAFQAGLDAAAKAPIVRFAAEDPEEFIE